LWGTSTRGVGGIIKIMNEPHTNREKKLILLKNGNRQGNPMNAPRCGAKTRSGTPCKGPAMANGRCRMHGGKSTCPRTPEGLERSRNANLKHGLYSAEALEERKIMRQMLRNCRETLEQVENRGKTKL
jgi:hypothetical protein